jgi:predicted dehydrogenase
MTRAFGSPKTPRTVGCGRKPGNAYASHSRRFRFAGVAIQTSCAISSSPQPLETKRRRGLPGSFTPKNYPHYLHDEPKIRVGIVGANTRASWAKVSHMPAIDGLPGLELAAVAPRNEQSAREAAQAFGAERWFADPFAMIRDDRIDVVTIAVRVPAHRELVLAALDAGKAVYYESPLGRSVPEAEEMAGAAGSLHTTIGLQGRSNPAVRRAAQVVSSGEVGRALNASVVSTTIGFGPKLPSAHNYFNKGTSGANLLTISAGHSLDAVEAILGPVIEVDARAEILWPLVNLTDTGEQSVRETADHVCVLGKTRSGAAFHG